MKKRMLALLLILSTTIAAAQIDLKQASIQASGGRSQGSDLSLVSAAGQGAAVMSTSARFNLRSGMIAAPPRTNVEFIFADNFEEFL